MRSTLLPGLLAIARRNVGRGTEGLALYETGLVFLPGSPGSAGTAGGARPVRPGVTDRPSAAELAAVEALLPEQPLHVAAVLAGALEPAGTWGRGRSAGWQDAVAAARTAAEPSAWHSGRAGQRPRSLAPGTLRPAFGGRPRRGLRRRAASARG